MESSSPFSGGPEGRASSHSSAKLTGTTYGKSDIRLTKVIRNGAIHHLLEFSVDILLSGDFADSYLIGDNKKIIATDSMKNTVYVLAKENDFSSAEEFAILLTRHFPRTYDHVRSAFASVEQTTWNRIPVNGHPHDHAFICGGPEKRFASAVHLQTGEPIGISGGISDLLVLKTTNSAFKDFVTDRYRTLKDTDDRIFATTISANWDYQDATADFATAHEKIRTALLEVFATHMSYAVQQTMYEMAKAALAACPQITKIDLQCPNKHRIPFNLQPFGLENKNEIFVWTDEPFGNITATVKRE
jgi:urate oxidase